MTDSRSNEEQVTAALRTIVHAVHLHSRRLVESFGLTGPQLSILQLAAQSGKTPIGRLAGEVRLSKGTVTGIVARLEQRGLLRRLRDGTDRRTVNVVVTTAGSDLLSQAPSLLHDRFRRELARLPDWQQGMTLAVLKQIASMMESDSNLETQKMPAETGWSHDKLISEDDDDRDDPRRAASA